MPTFMMLDIMVDPSWMVLFLLTPALIVILVTIFWIVELVDVLRRQFPDPNAKIIWVLVVLLTHTLGALIYYFVGKKQGTLPGSP